MAKNAIQQDGNKLRDDTPLFALTRLLARQAAREWVEAQLGAVPTATLTPSTGGAHG